MHGWARSRAGFANRLTLKRLNAEGTRTMDAGVTVIDGETLPPVATSIGQRPWGTVDGPKLYRRGQYYYIFAPAGGVQHGWQAVFRARTITGPYEARNVLDAGSTPINGPHQGAWGDTGTGQDWFLHFQDTDSYGRRVHLQPMIWRDGWPVIGADPDGDGRGEPVLCHPLPDTVTRSTVDWPSASRLFRAGVRFAYSLDGEHFVDAGVSMLAREGRWVGAQIGLFALAASGTPAFTATSNGHADFDAFTVRTQEPAARTPQLTPVASCR